MPNEFSSDTGKTRREYSRGTLEEAQIAKSPFDQFEAWFAEAQQIEEGEVNAMSLATSNASGQPSVRMVLLKDIVPDGFIFFTSYASRKGSEIASNAKVALLFYWPRLERQVRIEGLCSTVDEALSDRYFQSRPRNAQLGATVSIQSKEILTRAELEKAYSEAERSYDGQTIPRPKHWGGYIVRPNRFEFWQGRESRLHDRIQYQIDNGKEWRITRLSP